MDVVSLNPNYTEPRWIRGIGVELTENRPNCVYFFTLTLKLISYLPFDKASDRRITGTIRESIGKHNNAQRHNTIFIICIRLFMSPTPRRIRRNVLNDALSAQYNNNNVLVSRAAAANKQNWKSYSSTPIRTQKNVKYTKCTYRVIGLLAEKTLWP